MLLLIRQVHPDTSGFTSFGSGSVQWSGPNPSPTEMIRFSGILDLVKPCFKDNISSSHNYCCFIFSSVRVEASSSITNNEISQKLGFISEREIPMVYILGITVLKYMLYINIYNRVF